MASERAFDRIIAFYGRTLTWVLKRQTATLLVAAATLVLTVILYIFIPKASSRARYGHHSRHFGSRQSVSFPAMADKQQQLTT